MQRAFSPSLALAVPFASVLFQGFYASGAARGVKPASWKHEADGVDAICNLLSRYNGDISKAKLFEGFFARGAVIEFANLNIVRKDVPAITVILGL